MQDPLPITNALADRLVAALTWISGTATEATDGGSEITAQQVVARDARNVRALANITQTLALVSMARNVQRAVDMAAEFYFDEDDQE